MPSLPVLCLQDCTPQGVSGRFAKTAALDRVSLVSMLFVLAVACPPLEDPRTMVCVASAAVCLVALLHHGFSTTACRAGRVGVWVGWSCLREASSAKTSRPASLLRLQAQVVVTDCCPRVLACSQAPLLAPVIFTPEGGEAHRLPVINHATL